MTLPAIGWYARSRRFQGHCHAPKHHVQGGTLDWSNNASSISDRTRRAGSRRSPRPGLHVHRRLPTASRTIPEPAGAVLGGGDLDAQDSAVVVAVGAGADRYQGVDVDHPPCSRILSTSASAATNVYDSGPKGNYGRLDLLVQLFRYDADPEQFAETSGTLLALPTPWVEPVDGGSSVI